MCRWFTYISPNEPCLLSDVLITPANAVSKQISAHYLPKLLPHGKDKDLAHAHDRLVQLRNSLLNYDGLGIAWYTPVASAYSSVETGQRPALYKSQNPPSNDFNFKNLCENIESTCVFAHVRASSGSAVTPINSHPFVFGRHTFMHNGTIDSFHQISRDLSRFISYPAYANIKGTTDSEYAAALYVTYLCGTDASEDAWQKSYTVDQMCDALKKAAIAIMTVQKQLLGEKADPNSMNFVVTDGQKLVTCRFRNHATEEPASLYWSQTAGTKLNRKYPGHPDGDKKNVYQQTKDGAQIGKHTIVASEPTTYDENEWTLIQKNHMLLVDEKGNHREIPLDYDSKLNATITYPDYILHPKAVQGQGTSYDDLQDDRMNAELCGNVTSEVIPCNENDWVLIQKSQMLSVDGQQEGLNLRS